MLSVARRGVARSFALAASLWVCGHFLALRMEHSRYVKVHALTIPLHLFAIESLASFSLCVPSRTAHTVPMDLTVPSIRVPSSALPFPKAVP